MTMIINQKSSIHLSKVKCAGSAGIPHISARSIPIIAIIELVSCSFVCSAGAFCYLLYAHFDQSQRTRTYEILLPLARLDQSQLYPVVNEIR